MVRRLKAHPNISVKFLLTYFVSANHARSGCTPTAWELTAALSQPCTFVSTVRRRLRVGEEPQGH